MDPHTYGMTYCPGCRLYDPEPAANETARERWTVRFWYEIENLRP